MNKKLLELVVLIICSTSFCLGETVEFVQSQKDAPSFFDSLDKNQDSGFVRDVRVPRGFYGMRGKKDLGVNEVEKRALLGIPMSRERIIDRNRLQESNMNSFVPKRAQFPGFFGIRGNQQPTDYDNEIVGDKRAPSGFMGMRGKKSYDEDYLNMDSAYPNSQSNEGYFNNYDKRAPRGFFAMRGKKSLESLEPQNL